jgi:uncharacterized membrane protein
MRFLLFVFSLTVLLTACNNNSSKKEESIDTAGNGINNPGDTTVNARIPVADTIFKGMGTEPFWAVYVIDNRNIVFHPSEGDKISVPFVAPVVPDNITTKYNSANDSVTLELILLKKNCNNGMSDIVYPYEVNLKINAMTLKGCGEFAKH